VKSVRRAASLLTIVALSGSLFCSYASTVELSIHDKVAIRRAVAAIKSAILSGRTDELLRAVSPMLGLTCAGTSYSYHTVAHFLSDRNSHLYMGLFDSAALSRACSQDFPDVSEQEFLRSGESTDDITKVGPGWVEVTVHSNPPTHPPRVWSLHREAGGWKLADGSLLVGSCSCG